MPAGEAAPAVAFLPGPEEARLLALLYEAEVFAAQLGMPVAEVAHLLAVRAGVVAAVLATLRAALAESGVLRAGGEAADSIDALLGLLGRPAPMRRRSRLASHARRIAEAAADLHGDVVAAVARARRRLERPVLEALRRFERAHDELQLRLRVAAAVERLTRALRGRQLDQRRRELLLEATALARRLEEHRDRLARRRQRGALPCREQDAELHAGVEEIATELARLLA